MDMDNKACLPNRRKKGNLILFETFGSGKFSKTCMYFVRIITY